MLKYTRLHIITLSILLLGFIVKAQDNGHEKGEIIVHLVSDFPVSELCHQLALFKDEVTSIQPVKCLSKDLNIHLIQFNYNLIDEITFFEHVYAHTGVISAQFNHKITKRSNPPNDSLFYLQWQLYNDGSTGGTIDADIDADQAGDTTTGGLTALGDTIVIAVIDDGIDEARKDFGDNIWINYHEIPANGIDDDLNGYIDDYYGWNTYYDDNDVFTGGGYHGTSVAGIIGAKGNNTSGVAGINWNTKLMIIVGGGDEADAITSYSYVLAMRKLYNSSNGAKGAYIVATNASWGIDFGKAADAPIWCSLYDSLGKHGVLNVGATANADRDVDVEGDLPSQCPSKYLIIATNTDKNDLKVNGAAYGKIHVDLGSPGKNVFTTDDTKSDPDGFDYFGGTSAAAPQVAGVIGLLYAAACENLMKTAKTNPDSVAFLMRKFLLNGTDLKGSLINITTTQGRLNAYNAILESSKFCYNTSINEHPTRANSLIKNIYPNPVKDKLIVELNNHQNSSLDIKIYSIFGKELLTLANRNYNQHLDLNHLSSGYYILSVFNPENNQFEQVGFVKQ